MPAKIARLSKAFTLIELLVVIGIIAVLSGAILYSTENAREKARDKQRKDGLEAIRTAAVAYYSDHGEFPTICNDPIDSIPDDPQLDDCEEGVSSNTSYFTSASTDDVTNWFGGGALNDYFHNGKIPLDPNQIAANTVNATKGLASLPGKIASWFTASNNQTNKAGGQVASCSTSSGVVTCTYQIASGSDDVQATHDGTENNTSFNSGTSGIMVGTANNGYFHKAGLRFTNITIPKNTTITSATLKLTPKSSGNPVGWPLNTSTTLNTRITSDIAHSTNPTFSNYNDFLTRLVSAEDYPPAWHHVTDYNNVPGWNDEITKNITVTPIVQREINDSKWSSTSDIINFFWYPQDFHPANIGRIFHSYESDQSKAPVLEITYNAPTPPPAGIISCEAENFTLAGGYLSINPDPFPGSNNGAIWDSGGSPSEDLTPSLAPPGLGTATKQVYVSTAGTYYFWARTRYPSPDFGNNNSFFLKVDSGNYIIVGNEDTTDPNFHWVNFVNNNPSNKINFTLSQGYHTIELRVREDHNKIDKIELTTDPAYVPNNFGASENCPTSPPPPPPSTQCSDGVDNADPEDTLIDLSDPGCENASDDDESNTPPADPPGGGGQPEGDDKCQNACKIGYQLRHDKKWFRIWVYLENKSDPQRVGGPNATCNPTSDEIQNIDPSGTLSLYCIESPPI